MIKLHEERCLDYMVSIRNLATLNSETGGKIRHSDLLECINPKTIRQMSDFIFSINAIEKEGYIKYENGFNFSVERGIDFCGFDKYLIIDMMISIRNEVYSAKIRRVRNQPLSLMATRVDSFNFNLNPKDEHKQQYEIALKAIEKEGYIEICGNNIRFERYIFS